MTADAKMRTIIAGRLYWANRRGFLKPGLHLWTGKRHVRLVAIPREVPHA